MITVQDLSFSYPGAARPALSGLSFAIARGEVFGFLGPSGAGKSTTQKLLIGLLRGYQGRIEVFGRALAAWGSDYYERIGVSFELPNHFQKLTARENLAYFAALYRRPTQSPAAVLEAVGLADAADMPVAQFSKGMKNRLSLARALQHRPELLFLDEPTSGLDPASAQRIKQLIRARQAAGDTVVLTTHAMSLAEELCDRVAFIVDGQIALIDTPRALRLRYGSASVRVEYQAGEQLARAEFALPGLGENHAFLSLLRERPVQTIHTLEASLDEIFIRVTGRSLS
ncbi:MAG TPA: ABC transporter ATP-binding protein [Kouleothrix sp.]|uniref:ABC transporter ATP-binding protein n=1 Tax=Kouleothrix sp. TaxID=2779161 RepID=UPI002C66A674|nr:ABC transporter ATP-binding protein [Kouleothrix sp.]HRC76219.1 ABC transporter ATP-binding protein [Kouleothrix sp.]